MTMHEILTLPGGGVYGRSAKAEVRNPILGLPAFRDIVEQVDPETRRLLGTLLRQLAAQAARLSEKNWRGGKAWMGVYWRCIAVYAKHIARAVDPGSERAQQRKEVQAA